jgi:hypothetical protein
MSDAKKGCRKSEEMKGAPAECSPEQIGICHGDVEGHPCVEAAGCEHPEKLKGKPGECSPEQIRECHGDASGPPWVERG